MKVYACVLDFKNEHQILVEKIIAVIDEQATIEIIDLGSYTVEDLHFETGSLILAFGNRIKRLLPDNKEMIFLPDLKKLSGDTGDEETRNNTYNRLLEIKDQLNKLTVKQELPLVKSDILPMQTFARGWEGTLPDGTKVIISDNIKDRDSNVIHIMKDEAIAIVKLSEILGLGELRVVKQ